MIDCPKCGKKVYEKDDICPYCGCDIKNTHEIGINISTIFTIILIFCGVIATVFGSILTGAFLLVVAITLGAASTYSSEGKTKRTAYFVAKIAVMIFTIICIIGYISNTIERYKKTSNLPTNTININEAPIGTEIEGTRLIKDFPTIYDNHFSLINSILGDYVDLYDSKEYPFASKVVIGQDRETEEKRINISYKPDIGSNTNIQTYEEYSFEKEELKKLIITITRNIPTEKIIEEKILFKFISEEIFVGNPPDSEIISGLKKACLGRDEGNYLINDQDGNVAWSIVKNYETSEDGTKETVTIEIKKGK